MELVQIKIKRQAITARYGMLSDGDTLRTDEAYAKHLVEDCDAAEYVQAKTEPEPRRTRKAKS